MGAEATSDARTSTTHEPRAEQRESGGMRKRKKGQRRQRRSAKGNASRTDTYTVYSICVPAPIAGPDRRKAAIARASVRHPEGRGLLGRAAECEPAGLPYAIGAASQFAEHVHRRRRRKAGGEEEEEPWRN